MLLCSLRRVHTLNNIYRSICSSDDSCCRHGGEADHAWKWSWEPESDPRVVTEKESTQHHRISLVVQSAQILYVQSWGHRNRISIHRGDENDAENIAVKPDAFK